RPIEASDAAVVSRARRSITTGPPGLVGAATSSPRWSCGYCSNRMCLQCSRPEVGPDRLQLTNPPPGRVLSVDVLPGRGLPLQCGDQQALVVVPGHGFRSLQEGSDLTLVRLRCTAIESPF